jgi:hypothetical protein
MTSLQSKIFLVGAAILVQLLGLLTFAATIFARELYWAQSPGNGQGFPGNGQGFAVAVDSSGNSYVTGAYSGTMTFAPGVTLTAVNLSDIFVAKYDSTGTAVWATSAGGTGNDGGHGIAVDGDENSYVTGQLGGSTLFVAKYNSNGILVWITSPGTGDGKGVAVDGDGNSYVTGTYSGTLTFSPAVTLTAEGGNDIFVASYDIAGNFRWAKSAGGTDGEQGFAIAVDASGNSYVTGVYLGTTTFVKGLPEEELNSLARTAATTYS